jgi:hypothetical protein
LFFVCLFITMSDAADGNVSDQLQNIVGLRPSASWMGNYRANSPQQHGGQADAILQHILYQDLRNVVREEDPPASNNNNTLSWARQWRQMAQSQEANNNNNLQETLFQGTLPESFCLMVQVEEIVDVSRNAETRYEAGGGNPQNRCLKLCISDGYFDNGTPFPVPSNDSNSINSQPISIMSAMEVSPIPNLAFNSKAGIKLVLKGPIDMRWGIMMLNEGNTLVLGGEVPHLIEIQAKAVEQARKLAGVGVDPTVRALIWNPETGNEQGTFVDMYCYSRWREWLAIWQCKSHPLFSWIVHRRR